MEDIIDEARHGSRPFPFRSRARGSPCSATGRARREQAIAPARRRQRRRGRRASRRHELGARGRRDGFATGPARAGVAERRRGRGARARGRAGLGLLGARSSPTSRPGALARLRARRARSTRRVRAAAASTSCSCRDARARGAVASPSITTRRGARSSARSRTRARRSVRRRRSRRRRSPRRSRPSSPSSRPGRWAALLRADVEPTSRSRALARARRGAHRLYEALRALVEDRARRRASRAGSADRDAWQPAATRGMRDRAAAAHRRADPLGGARSARASRSSSATPAARSCRRTTRCSSIPIRHVLVRHEQGAAHMADGYARASGRVGVALATSGPGATNLVTGIATAMLDSVADRLHHRPGRRRRCIGSDAFQETDITGVTLPITKHNYLVTRAERHRADDPRGVLRRALAAGPGPVLVDITKDAQQGTTVRRVDDRAGRACPATGPSTARAATSSRARRGR